MGELADTYREALALGEAIKERLAMPLNPSVADQVIDLVEARGKVLAEAGEKTETGGDKALCVARLEALMHQQQILGQMVGETLAGLQAELQEVGRARMQLAQTGSAIRLREPSRHLDTRR